jgi:hypothetical protein
MELHSEQVKQMIKPFCSSASSSTLEGQGFFGSCGQMMSYRRIDGRCNNANNEDWGSMVCAFFITRINYIKELIKLSPFQRAIPADYADGNLL